MQWRCTLEKTHCCFWKPILKVTYIPLHKVTCLFLSCCSLAYSTTYKLFSNCRCRLIFACLCTLFHDVAAIAHSSVPCESISDFSHGNSLLLRILWLSDFVCVLATTELHPVLKVNSSPCITFIPQRCIITNEGGAMKGVFIGTKDSPYSRTW